MTLVRWRTRRERLGTGALIGIVLLAVAFAAAIVVRQAGEAATERIETESDQFWARLEIEGIRAESFASLNEMVSSADAVVIGRVVDVQPGLVVRSEDYPTDDLAATYNANMIVEVTDRLSGSVQPGLRLTVEFLLGIGQPYSPDLAQGLPKETSVFVLRDKVVFQKRMGQPPKDIEAAKGLYWIITDEAVFRDLDGKVRVLRNAVSTYVRQQDARSWEDFIAELRATLGP